MHRLRSRRCRACDLWKRGTQTVFGEGPPHAQVMAFRVSVQRGAFVPSSLAPHVLATVHPAAILRAPDDETRRTEMQRLVEDLTKVARVLDEGTSSRRHRRVG